MQQLETNSDEESSSEQLITRRKSSNNLDDTANDEDDVIEDQPVVSKGRGMGREYSKILNLPDYPAAKKYMSEIMPNYVFRYGREGLDGDTKYYRRGGFLKCPKMVYIRLHCESSECSIHQSTEDHEHLVNSAKIPQQVIDLVQQCLADNIISNKRILEKCREQHFAQITTMQLNNLKSRLKAKKLGKATSTNLDEIIKWCEAGTAIPSDPDEVFCGGIDHVVDSNDQLVHLREFVTTGRLLALMHKASKVLATDGTYKLIYEGFPILMVGTVDMNREYHPYGIMITKTEDWEDYKFMCERLKCLASLIGATDFNPTVLLADCAAAITNGFKSVFTLGNYFFVFIIFCVSANWLKWCVCAFIFIIFSHPCITDQSNYFLYSLNSISSSCYMLGPCEASNRSATQHNQRQTS